MNLPKFFKKRGRLPFHSLATKDLSLIGADKDHDPKTKRNHPTLISRKQSKWQSSIQIQHDKFSWSGYDRTGFASVDGMRDDASLFFFVLERAHRRNETRRIRERLESNGSYGEIGKKKKGGGTILLLRKQWCKRSVERGASFIGR